MRVSKCLQFCQALKFLLSFTRRLSGNSLTGQMTRRRNDILPTQMGSNWKKEMQSISPFLIEGACMSRMKNSSNLRKYCCGHVFNTRLFSYEKTSGVSLPPSSAITKILSPALSQQTNFERRSMSCECNVS